jgi:hypothetical protein
MARECVCGCGRKLGFNDRSISKKGARSRRRPTSWRSTWCPRCGNLNTHPRGVEVFIEECHAVRNQLVAVIHKELRPAPSIGVVWPRGTESEVAHQLHDGRRR